VSVIGLLAVDAAHTKQRIYPNLSELLNHLVLSMNTLPVCTFTLRRLWLEDGGRNGRAGRIVGAGNMIRRWGDAGTTRKCRSSSA
jgi:hypothetical protein